MRTLCNYYYTLKSAKITMNYSQDESAHAVARRAGVQRRLKKRVAERRVIHKVHSLCLDPQKEEEVVVAVGICKFY